METKEFSKVVDVITRLVETKLSEKVETLLKDSVVSPDKYSSDSLTEFAPAFSKAQSEYKHADFNRVNPYFDKEYADLYTIKEAVKDALAKNGLSMYQFQQLDGDGKIMLHTRLLHDSGQWIETRARIVPPKDDQQSYGSTLAFQKRQCAQMILGIAPANDHYDDDAEIAMITKRDIIAKGPSNKYNPKEQTKETISKDQLDELEYELSQYPDIAEEILDGLRLQSLADMPKSKFLISITRVREIKRLRNEGR